MIELKDGINFHNFNLDCKPNEWFKRRKGEFVKDWLKRVSYISTNSIPSLAVHWKESMEISLEILDFIDECGISKEELEYKLGFELNFKNHDWKISEIKKFRMVKETEEKELKNLKEFKKNMVNKITFDFDGTLSKVDVQDYAKSLILKGFKVFIVTARYNELMKHKWSIKPCNEILFKVADKIGIPHNRIIFCNMEDKSKFLDGSGALFHLDDDVFTIEDINENSDVVCIDVTKKDWKKQCDAIINQKSK